MAETCANPLLLGWIKEWLDQARERNSKGFTVYKKAYDSMKVCPLAFNHPSEAIQLNGLGPKLCDRLTEKLKEHCEANGLPMPEAPSKGQKRHSGDNLPDVEHDQPTKKPRKVKPYVPALRSGGYALLIGLATLDENSSQGLTKAHLIDLAQPYSDSSFTTPSDPTKFYTAWNSMKTLIQKDLVYEHGRPLRKYALTEEGWEVAKRIRNTATGTSLENQTGTSSRDTPTSLPPPARRYNEVENSSRRTRRDVDDFDWEELGESNRRPLSSERSGRRQGSGENSSIPTTTEPIALPPGSFTVELILDSREVRTQKDRDYIANELAKRGVAAQVRALELGDAMWVAKCKDPNFLVRHGEESDEVMLDWIIERKRLDDLIGSIKDGRFQEQKFRLRRCGIKNVIYLVEEFNVTHDASSSNAARYQEMAATAIASTQVVNGYFVKKTKNLDDTIRYLARMTFLLRKMYEPSASSEISSCSSAAKPTSVALMPSAHISSQSSYLSTLQTLRAADSSNTTTYGVTFSTFSALTSKSDVLTLRDVFLKMLMCAKGITGEKALEIQRRWPTPRHFIEAFEAIDRQSVSGASTTDERLKVKERMIADKMAGLIGRKKVALQSSRRLAEYWGEGE